MNQATEVLLQDKAAALRRSIWSETTLSRSDAAFLAWCFRENPPGDDLATLANESATSLTAKGERSYHDVAALGFAARGIGLNQDQLTVLAEGLQWLGGRSPRIAGEPAPFVSDAVAILGIALGGAFVGDNTTKVVAEWMRGFVSDAAGLPALEEWQRMLFAAALHALGIDALPIAPDESSADVRTVLRAMALAPKAGTREEIEKDERLTLESLKQADAAPTLVIRAALSLKALVWIQRSAPVILPGRATVTDIAMILERTSAGLRRWTWEENARTRGGQAQKWYVDHEYHVQNLLYFLLGTIFPDLKDEENFPSIGQKKPRADLFIASLRLIIEVKFIREKDPMTKILDEVASDAGLYLAEGSDYTGIIAFVWDDSRRSEEHSLLKNGLRRIQGVLDAVVVSRPGAMR